ncbi:hypothetical protein KFU94_14635 [Chloroflexi bacterium TSY]|nr:hypothetical protein [Chloroflexi bacterium TSY]
MSTAVMLSLPEAGHLNALFPLIAELVQRGERVIVYAVEPFRQTLEATGAEYRSYSNPQALIPPAHEGGLFSVMNYLASASEAVLPALLDELRTDPPNYLLMDAMSHWGNLAQQILDLPAITYATTFVTHPQMPSEQLIQMSYQQLPKEVMLSGIDALHGYFERTQRLDRQYGTRSPNIVQAFSNPQELNILFTSREFHPGGQQFDEVRYKFVGPSVGQRAEATEFPFDQLSDAPLVFVSLGTIFNERPDFYQACFGALGDLPVQVVLSVGDKIDQETLGTMPANFMVRSYVPQLELLQRAALFITHGGMNSASEGLLYGVPLLVVPQHGDQFLVASQVAEIGAGTMLPAAQASAEALKGLSMQIISDPQFKARAQALSESFRASGGHVRAADEILTYMKQAHK